MKINKKDLQWQEKIYLKVKNLAGKRYTPELNIELPIIETFDGLSKNENFYIRIRKLYGNLRKNKDDIFPYNNADLLGIELINFDYCYEELLSYLSEIKEYSSKKIDWIEIKKITNKLDDLSWNLLSKVQKIQEGPDNEKKSQHESKIFSSQTHYIYQLRTFINELTSFCNSDAATLSNDPYMLLTGISGIGKTHLLCDLVRLRKDLNKFSFIALGQEFNGKDNLWKQIIKINADNRIKTKNKLLEKYDSLANKTNSRFIIIIDALNEAEDPRLWKNNLDSLLSEIKKYPNIALIVSIRNGFEKEVFTNKTKKQFHQIEHIGFQYREWEAIKIFFRQFNLPLPEIPLINPEFSIPLFLLLFCKSRQKRIQRNEKIVFRGHAGSTSIFEDFIREVAENIGKEFKIGTAQDVWSKLIKGIAQRMVENKYQKDRISEFTFKKLVKAKFPLVDYKKLVLSLERNYLILKVPKYSRKGVKNGFYYRFTYQRFSDHLISRYLLSKYADTKKHGKKTISYFKRQLQKTGTIGKYIVNYSFRGVIEALSIQVPERLDGVELLDMCLWAKDLLEEPFLESIIWRYPENFKLDNEGRPANTIKIINSHILRYKDGPAKLFKTILNVACVPNHPFNAESLHRYLCNLGMASRDSIWSTFLHHNYGEQGPVDRLLHWILSGDFKNSISEESRFLTGIVVTWFFTSSNRSIRDKATKCLVLLLENHLEILLKIHKLFVDVDDPYVIERLYVSTYGILLRTQKTNLSISKQLGRWLFSSIFKSKKITLNILIRDHARLCLELLDERGWCNLPKTSKSLFKIKSQWPKRIPTEKVLEDKYHPKNFNWDTSSCEDRGAVSIWNSMTGMADFFRYIVSPVVNRWSNFPKGNKLPPSIDEQKNKFLKSLNQKQRRLYDQFIKHKSNTVPIIIFKYFDSKDHPEEKSKLKEARRINKEISYKEKQFLNSLTIRQKQKFNNLNNAIRKSSKKSNCFNPEIAKRLILKRVFELYNPKLHGEFDGIYTSHSIDRETPTLERIGKKYQWIALFETLGLISDNYYFLKDRYGYKQEFEEYKYSWQVDLRDIDPTWVSNYRPKSKNSPWQSKYDAWKKNVPGNKWIKKRADLPDPSKLLEYKDKNGVDWIILNTYYTWEEEKPPEEEGNYHLPRRDISYIFNSYLFKNKNRQKLDKWFKNQNFYGRWMPEVRNPIQDCYFWEYPEHLAYKEQYLIYEPKYGWSRKADFGKIMPAGVMEIHNEYSTSMTSRDKSLEESFTVAMPSIWLIQKFNLKHSLQDGFWVNQNNEITCGDISLLEGGSSTLAFKKSEFLEFLKKKNFSLIWTLVGEKLIYGDRAGGMAKISGSYILDKNGNISGQKKVLKESSK